jgi:hypothetical protein
MATPNASYGDILSTTLQLLQGEIEDNISNNNAFFFELKDKGNIKTFDGGPKIVQPLEYAENQTVQWYSGYEQLDITPSPAFTAAEYEIKQLSISVSISGLEQIKNAGKSQMFDLMEARIKNAKHTYENEMERAVFAPGTGSGGKEIGGLQLLLADVEGSGTVGGISRSSYSWWQHYVYQALTDGGAVASVANIQTYMRRVWNQIFARTDKPTIILMDNNYYILFEESLTSIQRIQSDSNKLAKAGFNAYMFNNCPVVNCGGLGGEIPANHAYFINGNYIYLRPFSGRQFTSLNPTRHSLNQDAEVRLQVWAGNMTGSNFRRQGLLINT